MRLFRKAEERVNPAALDWASVWGTDTPRPMNTYSGTSVDETKAMNTSVVYAAVTLIADAIAGLPPSAQTVDEVTGAVTQQAVPQWIRKPHPDIRRSVLWNQLVMSLLLWGNAYALLVRRPSDGQIVGMVPLKPGNVYVEWDPARPGGYRRYKIDAGPWMTSYEVFHIQGPTFPGEPKGMSVIRAAREAIGLAMTLEEFGARYFAQGSMHKVVIKSKEAMDDRKAAAMVKTYERFHKGPGNWHRPAVFAGDGDLQMVSIPPEDAQFLQTREFQAMDLARWFRVPPHRVGIMTKTSSWGSGLSEENTMMVQTTYRPWILRIEEMLTAYAPGGEAGGVDIKLIDSSLLRGTWKEQVEAWTIACGCPIATPNEARLATGFSPLPGGDKLVEKAPPAAAGAPAKSESQKKEADKDRKQDEANE